MLYATDPIDQPQDLGKPMVGIANVWSVFPTPFVGFLLLRSTGRRKLEEPRPFLKLTPHEIVPAFYRYEGNP